MSITHGSAVAASSGIAIGRVQRILPGHALIPEHPVHPDAVQDEITRFMAAIESSLHDLDEDIQQVQSMESREPLQVLQAHRMMLLDPSLSSEVKSLICTQSINAEWALRQSLDKISDVFDKINDPYLRNGKMDVIQAVQRIMDHLTCRKTSISAVFDGGTQSQILVGKEFSPGEVVRLWRQGYAGFVAEQGGINNHVIIIARGIGLPALTGAVDIVVSVKDGDTLILDAERGAWMRNPDEVELEKYQHFSHTLSQARHHLKCFAGQPSVSADGRVIKLMANLEFTEELPLVHETGVDGIGLYRTEFFFMNHEVLPNEETQYQHYAEVVRNLDGLPVTFRVLDIGSDKPTLFTHLASHPMPNTNPAMGMRGIRLLLNQPHLLRIQLKALLRAGLEGSIQILLPMISHPEEVQQVRDIMHQCAKELGITQIPPLGVMIEVPAAAITATALAEVSDFFSVGSNDLIQYTLAADRSDECVAHLYNPGHPAVQQLIQNTVQAAIKADIPVSICGEMAGDVAWTETLLRMGFNTLSMSVSKILAVREKLSQTEYKPV